MAIERIEGFLPPDTRGIWIPNLGVPETLWTPSDKTLLKQFKIPFTGEAKLMQMEPEMLNHTFLGWINRYLTQTGDYIGALTMQSGLYSVRSIHQKMREDNETPEANHMIRAATKLLVYLLTKDKTFSIQTPLLKKRPSQDKDIALVTTSILFHDSQEDYNLNRKQLGLLLFEEDPYLPGPKKQFVEDVFIGIEALNINKINPFKKTEVDYNRYYKTITAIHKKHPYLRLWLQKGVDRGDSMKGDLSRYLRMKTDETYKRLQKSIAKTEAILPEIEEYEPAFAKELKTETEEAKSVKW